MCVQRQEDLGSVCERFHEVAWVVQGCVEGLHTWGKRLTQAWPGTYARFKNK